MIDENECKYCKDRNCTYAGNPTTEERIRAYERVDSGLCSFIKVLIVEPKHTPYLAEIPNEIVVMQKIVDGYIETPSYLEDVVFICNKEGKIKGLPLHRHITGKNGEWLDIIAGTFIIAGSDGKGNFTSLTDEQITKYEMTFLYPYTYREEDVANRSVIHYGIGTVLDFPATHEEYRIEHFEKSR